MNNPRDCLFCRIASGELPSQEVYRDDEVYVFQDINPVAPVHLVIIPFTHFGTAAELAAAAPHTAAALLRVAGTVADNHGLAGYRLVFNTGVEGGQRVFHVHLHVIGGRPLHWPPG
jgi:histidine triad (HIT) family protein